LGWLGKQLHELENLLRHLARDRKPQFLSFLEGDRVIVRPGAFGEHASKVCRLIDWVAILQEFQDTLLHLS
jgi:hypothetical protein